METIAAARYVSATLSFAPHLVGNGLARSAYHGFTCTHQSGNRNKCIRRSSKAPLKSLPLAELEGKMPLAADEVLLYPRRRRYFVDICIGLVNNHRSG